MVLEMLLQDAVDKPLHLFFLGAVFATIGILVATILFPASPSLALVIFMSLPCFYIFTNKLKEVSKEQLEANTLGEIFDANSDIMDMYLYIFLGMTFAVIIWFSIMPTDVSNSIFTDQLYNLRAINMATQSGNFFATGNAVSENIFMKIALNNIRLVIIFALLSFLFGSGAIFIMAWNATVVGVAIGLLVKRIQSAGSSLFSSLARGLSIGTSYYILHLIPEIVAYFLAAIAGALISSAMTRYDKSSEKASKLFMIAGGLIVTAIIIILLAAVIEINISHMIQLRISP
jgi:uncharacterized membrane protein SpoIIM required for sporulation